MAMKISGAVATLLIAAGAAFAALGAPTPTDGAAQPFRLGTLQLFALRDAENTVPDDGKTFGTDVGPAAVAGVLREAGAPTDRITLSVDALVVEAPGRILLFDTGLGPSFQGALPASLAKAGVAPSAVTDVFITHSHGDHVGGLVATDGRAAFPNAVVHMSATEWAFMRSQPRAAAIVAAIAPQVKTFEGGGTVVAGVVAVPIPGHTPGHTGYEISSGAARLMDIGDTAHSSIISLARPQWGIEYDHDQAQGKASQSAMLARLAASHELVFAPHFPFPGVGRIVQAAEGYVWAPALQ